MERLRRKFFKFKISTRSKKSNKIDDEETYLEPSYDENSAIILHIDSIAEELLTIAKKSVRKIFVLNFDSILFF